LKKKSIVFALLAAAAAMATPLASAQSNVTIYGLLDVAVVHESGGTAGSMTKLTSGVGGGSRLGFKVRKISAMA
jgi:predicted porin